MGCITFGYNPFLMSGVVNAVTRVVTGGLSITNIAIFVIKDYRDSLYHMTIMGLCLFILMAI